MYYEYPSHADSAIGNEWWKVQFLQVRRITSQMLLFVLLLRCHHNPMRNFLSLMDVSRLALSYHLYFQVFYIDS